LGYAAPSIERHQCNLVRIAVWLRNHPNQPALSKLTPRIVPCLLARVLPTRHRATKMACRTALFHWLKFQGRDREPVTYPWGRWLRDYLDFLRTHQGVGRATLELNEARARDFLKWQFGKGPVEWSRVRPTDIWRFAHLYVRGIKPVHARAGLGYLRRFLSFLHLRGACGPELAAAIPKVAACGYSAPEILSEQQRRTLLDSFAIASPEGQRDYAMTLCMLDLGLRAAEVVALRLQDIDWKGQRLTIRASKTGRGRELPLPSRIAAALRDYIKNGRPQLDATHHVFVRHPRRRGYPLSRHSVKWAVRCAYRRCGFPRTWWGTHRLRHTFASRLHKHGVDVKPIADLLGHRRLDSTNIYTHVDLNALRALAQPWPR
jgi:site-specific recombinase XerD